MDLLSWTIISMAIVIFSFSAGSFSPFMTVTVSEKDFFDFSTDISHSLNDITPLLPITFIILGILGSFALILNRPGVTFIFGIFALAMTGYLYFEVQNVINDFNSTPGISAQIDYFPWFCLTVGSLSLIWDGYLALRSRNLIKIYESGPGYG